MRHFLISVTAAAALCACGGVKNIDSAGLAGAGGSAFKAMSLTDSDVQALANQSCTAIDAKSKIAAPADGYSKRLERVRQGLPNTINGQPASYKVYLTKDVNAWAMGNGCIRVYSGLMDLMNDDELRGVIGHEIGHVALGHSKKAMQTAYAASAVRGLAGASGNAAATALSSSQLGDFAEKLVNAQFSQSQESDADNYAFDLLTQQKLKREGLVTAFQKLGKLSGGSGSSMLSSHPASADRAARMQKRIDSGK